MLRTLLDLLYLAIGGCTGDEWFCASYGGLFELDRIEPVEREAVMEIVTSSIEQGRQEGRLALIIRQTQPSPWRGCA